MCTRVLTVGIESSASRDNSVTRRTYKDAGKEAVAVVSSRPSGLETASEDLARAADVQALQDSHGGDDIVGDMGLIGGSCGNKEKREKRECMHFRYWIWRFDCLLAEETGDGKLAGAGSVG